MGCSVVDIHNSCDEAVAEMSCVGRPLRHLFMFVGCLVVDVPDGCVNGVAGMSYLDVCN